MKITLPMDTDYQSPYLSLDGFKQFDTWTVNIDWQGADTTDGYVEIIGVIDMDGSENIFDTVYIDQASDTVTRYSHILVKALRFHYHSGTTSTGVVSLAYILE